MRVTVTLLAASLVFAIALPASADDGWGFRLTTPRGGMVEEGDDLLIAIPGGRAWGITSGLQRLPEDGGVVIADIEVRDDRVREAFLRLAYYDRAIGRPRQTVIVDSAPVRAGQRSILEVRIEAPPGAIAYRIRILGRLEPGGAAQAAAAIAIHDVWIGDPTPSPTPLAARRTRLIAER